MNTPLPYRHLSDLSERQLLQVIVDKLCCFAGKYILDAYTGAEAGYSLRKLSKDTTNVVRVRRSSDNSEDDFTADEITNGTLLSWVGDENLLLFSEEFENPFYLKSLGTLTPNQTTAPDGSLTADLFTKTSAVNTVSEIKRNNPLYPSTGIYTYSIYVKQNVGDDVLLRLDAGGNTANASFKFSTKSISTTGANAISATATELSDGWFRLTLTGNVTSISWSLSIVNLFTNATNDSVYVWGAQLEKGSTAGDYAPTTSNVSGYGYVTTWYDQAGSNNATQATAANQPKIVDAGVLVEKNGEPAILPDGVDDVFVIANSIGLLLSAFIVAQIGADAVDDEIISNSSGNEYIAIKTNRYVYRTSGSYNPFDFTSNKTYSLASIIAEGSSNPRSISCYENSIISTDSPLSLDALNLNANSVILGDGNDNYYPNKVQEIIIYNSDQSSNRTGIETNINNHYNIYP